MSLKRGLLEAFVRRKAKIAVIGLGYVGLPLGLAFAERGFPVVGLDVDQRKVASLREGRSYIQPESSPHKTPKSSRVSSRSLSTSPYALISNRSRSSRMPGIAMYQCNPWL